MTVVTAMSEQAHDQLEGNPRPEQLAPLMDFLVSHEGLDFHSDEDEITVQVSDQQEHSGAPAEANGTISTSSRIVLTHSFRSSLATDMLHKLDGPHGGSSTSASSRVGAELSAGMARILKQRPDLTLLYDQGRIDTLSAKRKRVTVEEDAVEDSEVQVSRSSLATSSRADMTHVLPLSFISVCLDSGDSIFHW